MENKMIDKYVLVRCGDAGVHAGYLVKHDGREVVLSQSRRLWYWKCRKGDFLSGVSEYGLHGDSKVGCPQRLLHLTEACEVALCSPEAANSISSAPSHGLDESD